ncbi:MAG: ClpX C4-type zinc finger protein, partial [Oscillospiraceae bacterium]
MANNKKIMRCAFCGKTQDEVDRMLVGPNIYICNECVSLCYSLLEEDGFVDPEFKKMISKRPVVKAKEEHRLLKPKEIKEVLDQYV